MSTALWVVKVQSKGKIEVRYGNVDLDEAKKICARMREDLAITDPTAIVYPPELEWNK